MAEFRYVGDNQYINLDSVDLIYTNDRDNWAGVIFASGREFQIDRQYIKDLLADEPVALIEAEAPKATKRK